MPVGATTIGPIAPELRDRFAEYRDQEGHANYNEALEALISEHEG